MKNNPSIQLHCIFTLLSESQGGRNIPVGDGWCPKIFFDGSSNEVFSMLKIDENEIIFPGNQYRGIFLIKPDNDITNSFFAGIGFDLYEGNKIVGSGTIMSVSEDNS